MKITRKIIRWLYKAVVKKILFLYTPDAAHNGLLSFARVWQSIPGARQFAHWLLVPAASSKLIQDIHGISINTPVGLSAGFDKNIELQPTMDMVGFGFMTGGSITLRPRKGNDRPWFYRLPKTQSIVVHAGLANRGLDAVLVNSKRHQTTQQRMPLFISVAVVAHDEQSTDEQTISEVCAAIQRIQDEGAAQAIEINISCPNVHDDQPFTRPKRLKQLLRAVDKQSVAVPLFIKMPNMMSWEQFDTLLQEIVQHNVQGVTVSNLVKDRDTVVLKDDLPRTVKGGLSGAPCRANSTDLIRNTYRTYGDRLTIIGVGGVFSADDAYEKIRAGASMVALITGLMFEGPQLIGDISQGLEERLTADGFSHIAEAIGVDVKNK